jgi:ABC-2 type transport system ATP-binding protein
MSDLAIRCRGLVKTYPPAVTAVDGLDLEVRRGECFGLLGPNGAGKTTTVEILEGLLAPSGGEVEVLGRRWGEDAEGLRERIGLTLQETHLYEKLTVRELVQLFRALYRTGREVEEVIRLVSLEEKAGTWYERLSGGQKQRLAVAVALVGDPELLFLDEPTTGLDPQSRRQLWDVVTDLKARGKTVLLTTHYMDEAERLCDRVAIVDRGKVIALGTPRELVAAHVGQEIVEFQVEGASREAGGAEVAADEAVFAALPAVQAVRRVAGGWQLVTDQVHLAIPALLAALTARGQAAAALSTHRATLEDVFVTLTGRRLRD